MLPDWLKQIAADCTEQERQQLNERLAMTSEREMRYRDNQAKRGLKMVRVWVPGTDTDKLKAYAKKLREAK